MTRARAKLLQAKVNSLLSLCDFDTPLDGLLLHNHALCIIRYEEKNPQDGGTPADKTKNSLSPAVLPDLATGTTAWRHYRQMLLPTTDDANRSQILSVSGGTTGPGTGTTALRHYRPLLPLPAEVANRSPRTASSTIGPGATLPYQAVLPVPSPVLPLMAVPARTSWATAHVSPLPTYSPSLSPNYPCLVAGL